MLIIGVQTPSDLGGGGGDDLLERKNYAMLKMLKTLKGKTFASSVHVLWLRLFKFKNTNLTLNEGLAQTKSSFIASFLSSRPPGIVPF